MSLQQLWTKTSKMFASPDKKQLSRISWGIGIAMLLKWTWDEEQENPRFFQERPQFFGAPQAKELQMGDCKEWNAAHVPQEQQLVWTPEKKGEDKGLRRS
ncbi:unnamed protein product [Polarella glacialis]|uniref:Uncharacterized protein n=1 Tax=Polarella glacialis TaxID=89957 RepID=A0A813K6M0_POLGL|nr:unnamed protein product [Polarella glacialis]CAE8609004.1 unnamed protein product [Polarella glacialis]CAE8692566.1 unnamed protein product [Polarella glacialis]|mmetsp:Transcript_70516/g.127168  ORF Transcript_70516/g.127168 Transcript_70516/m.127168 type:complete len:100 (+) Transcript_70516:21-320(+)